MTIAQIDKFIENATNNLASPVKIIFKTRNAVEGVFIRTSDFSELRGKNYWRIVTLKYLDNYSSSKDINCSRIFNGAEFTKLTSIKESSRQ